MIADYLKDRARVLALYFLYTGVSLSVGALSEARFALFLYPAGVVGFFLLLWLSFGYFKYRRKRRLLMALLLDPKTANDSLPKEHSPLLCDYGELALLCANRAKKLLDAEHKTQADSLDYYTLWIHQIKTPIAAMSMVLAEDGDAADANTLKAELFNVERYAELALKYVKLTDVSNDIVIERVDLNAAARECVKKYSLLFIRKRLTVRIDELKSDALTDRTWVSFILEQFISNAVKYTKTGGVHIYMEDGALCVRDTGAGIRKEDLPRVFKKGFTGAAGRQSGKASGIGLYLADKAARALSLSLDARAHPEGGTVFRIVFPQTDVSIYE